jgi:hypothetical protein
MELIGRTVCSSFQNAWPVCSLFSSSDSLVRVLLLLLLSPSLPTVDGAVLWWPGVSKASCWTRSGNKGFGGDREAA